MKRGRFALLWSSCHFKQMKLSKKSSIFVQTFLFKKSYSRLMNCCYFYKRYWSSDFCDENSTKYRLCFLETYSKPWNMTIKILNIASIERKSLVLVLTLLQSIVFLLTWKTKTKSVSIVEHHYVQKHLILQQYLQKYIDTDG